MTETENQVLAILRDIAVHPDQNDLTKMATKIIELAKAESEDRITRVLGKATALHIALQDYASKSPSSNHD